MERMKLYIGCGSERLEGYISVDVNPEVKPDIVALAWALPFEDNLIDEIETRHLFEHLTFGQAKAALKEWHRVLKPNGKLYIECPNILRCLEMLKSTDARCRHFGMVGLYGYPYDVGLGVDCHVPQMHKWGWWPGSLRAFLRQHEFQEIQQHPVIQTWRESHKYDRDMRMSAVK